MELLLHQWGDWPELYRNTDKTEATEIVIIDSQMNYRGKLDTYTSLSALSPRLESYDIIHTGLWLCHMCFLPERRGTEDTMKKYICKVCGWIYDEAQGDPDNGIEPGTKFEDLPADYICPMCGAGKEEFEEYDG